MTKAELYKKACMLPLLPGVYIIRDKSGTIIYIGKAKRLRIRVSQYFREGVPHDNKVSQMIAHAYAFDVIVCQSEFEALVLEASQIKAHTPKYNILLKDDKGYSYIKVTKDEWPRLSFTLQKEDDGAEYIGPYTSSFAARQMAETAMDAFLLPRCSRRFPQEIGRGRPCLNAHIGKCMAVCSGKISHENYEQAVKSAVHLIRYGKKDILKTLNERMLEASDRLEFETAALIRDQIAAITKVTAGQKVVVDPDVEMDVVALAGTPGSVCAAVLRFREGRLTDKREFLFHDTADIAAVREEFLPRYYLDDEQIPKVIAVDELPPDVDALQQALNEKRGSEVQLYVPQRGDKAHLVEMAHTNAVERLARESGRYAREEKLLDELAQVLGLPKPPRTIESYDISNWGDGTSVCGMVTFRDGKPYKAGYRKFKMKTVAGTDDYASLAETVSRRAAEYEKYSEMAANGEPSSNYFGQKPDLLLMDGGRGQVSAAKAALAGTALADVPLYGMVKDDHHRTRAIVDSEGREIAINMNRGTFTFVTAIQDETHRFANAYRKQQMKQKSYSSTLTEVPGVGPKTAKALRPSSRAWAPSKRPPLTSWRTPPASDGRWPRPFTNISTRRGEASGKVRRRPVCGRAFCKEFLCTSSNTTSSRAATGTSRATNIRSSGWPATARPKRKWWSTALCTARAGFGCARRLCGPKRWSGTASVSRALPALAKCKGLRPEAKRDTMGFAEQTRLRNRINEHYTYKM